MRTTHRAVVATNLSTHIHDVIAFSKGVVLATRNSPHFPGAQPLVDKVETCVAELEAAESVAQTKAKGSAEARDVKRSALLIALHDLKAHVQSTADANHDHAQAIIESTHFSVKRAGARTKGDFEVKQAPLSGSVILRAHAHGHRGSHHWDMSTDGGKTFTRQPDTLRADTVVHGLTPAQAYHFRHQEVTKQGEGDWSQVVSIIAK